MRNDPTIDAIRKANAGVPDEPEMPVETKGYYAAKIPIRSERYADWLKLKDQFDISGNIELLEAMMDHCLKIKL